MKIGTAFVMVVALATVITIPTLAGAAIGALVSFALSTNTLPAALIGALGGFCSGLAFLLNAGLNGEEKGL
jgi:hypothetical protein